MSSFYGKRHKRNSLIFYCLLLLFPIAQFCIFYIGVNFNSLRFAFSTYDYDSGKYMLVGFDNFVTIFKMFSAQDELWGSIKNSLIVYVVNLIIGISLALLFSYYIFRKMAGYKTFKVLLFLPSILSSMSLTIIFRYFSERALPFMVEKLFSAKMEGLLANLNTMFPTIIAFSLFVSFGTSVLMYVGAMNNVSESILESARLDGATPMREFVSIVLPMIYPTLVTFLVVATAGIFTNQINLYNFFGPNATFSVYTIGYYLYRNTHVATLGEYPQLAAFGILGTVVAVPLTFLVRWLMGKFGPSTGE